MTPFQSRLCTFALLLFSATTLAQVDTRLNTLSDAPDPSYQRQAKVAGPATYDQALLQWKSADAVNSWLGSNFSYDSARALELSETARAAGSKTTILTPESFFVRPQGICVDMARFAVATLRHIAPQSQAAYLMIEFEPVRISGQVLRRHWLATFERDGAHYFFADSKRPGHMAGPYRSVDAFIAEYGAYRGRAIVAHKVLPSHERRMRKQAPKAAAQVAAGSPPGVFGLPGHGLTRG